MFLLLSVYIPVCSANICLANKKLLPCCFGSERLPACPPLCMSASPSLSYSLQGFNANNPQVPLEAHRQVHGQLPCKVQQRLRPCWRGSVLAPSRWCQGSMARHPQPTLCTPCPALSHGCVPLVAQTPGLQLGRSWMVLPSFPRLGSDPGDVLPSLWIRSMQKGCERLLTSPGD